MAKINMFLYFIITLMVMMIPLISSAPTYVDSVCSNTTMFTTKSQYQTNLDIVFRYLSANATNPNGFHTAQAGNGTKDFVYGHFLCRGDQVPSSCLECVSTATTSDLPNKYCPNRKEAIIWYDQCMVRYSNQSFFGVLDENPRLILSNTQNVSGNVSQFMDIMGKMMNNVVLRASNGGPNKKYGTTYAPYPSVLGIYGLEQCTPDLSTTDCSQCLVNAIGRLPISEGGQTIFPSCYARFEISPFFNGASNLTVSPPPPSLPPSPPTSRNNSTRTSSSSGKSKTSAKLIAIIVAVVFILFLALLAIILYFVITKSKKIDIPADDTGEDFTTLDSLQYDLTTLKSATNNFGDENKLGEGGFGSVYKGILPNGEVIAVKRLSRSSGQGAGEFKNELLLLAKLQHRNLARLLGFCLSGEEKLLVYEFAPNKSLDNLLFDPITQEQINWGVRYNIIQGIARGLLYLHQDSRLRIIHRDLKASNILLDANMNPKISDFGMARIFGGDQTQSNTSRVVGTFGYMAPEYVMHGRFSTKSDMYSFGVLVLEIISGKRNSSFYESGYAEDLISYAWKLWEEGKPLMLVDPAIRESCSSQEVMRCVQLGLLCVQESVEARPSIETVVLSLDSFTITLPVPGQPPFFGKSIAESEIGKIMISLQSSENNSIPASVNDVSVSEMEPR
ncbi:cysteine-rich receptor-like protein kinase 10 isoform X3 [Silene latifolia]|uniref:cysteine-rich receptor-like protein kinase 10 isoform X3 n=1 Tax=Silene latifolia TaxID=37657 RepID=UPI003D76EEC4